MRSKKVQFELFKYWQIEKYKNVSKFDLKKHPKSSDQS